MSAALPTWAVVVLSVGAPVSALAGVLITAIITRRAAREADARAQRGEVLRLLRWAAELAVAADDRSAELGVEQLRALALSGLADGTGLVLIEAALTSTAASVPDVQATPTSPASPASRILSSAPEGGSP